MFGKLFRKKQEVPIDELGETLLQNLMRFVDSHVEIITQDKDLPFHNIDRDRLFTELLVLSFWNLNFLQYPFEVFNSVLRKFLQNSSKTQSERDNLLNFMEDRSKTYFDSWKETSENLPYFASIIAKNIDEQLTFNVEVHLHLINFFSHMTQANATILKNIRDEMKIIL